MAGVSPPSQTDTRAMNIQDLYQLASLCKSISSASRRVYIPLIELLAALAAAPLEDTTMLRLLRHGTVADIEICLYGFPPGKLLLESSFFCTCNSRPADYECKESQSIQEYSPLWGVTHRGYDDDNEMRILFDLFISRGEDANARNEPSSTLYHAVVIWALFTYTEYSASGFKNRIDLLASHQVRFDLNDHEDNPSELCWKHVHNSSHEPSRNVSCIA
jgi:hypothetical protein